MKAENLTWDNASRRLTLFGYGIVWWHSTQWSDGYFHPPFLEFETPKHSLSIRMGRQHPSDAIKHKVVKYA